MCEFCSFGPNSNKTDRDSTHPVFSGFFSADAIEAAVRQATKQAELHRQSRRAQNQKNIDHSDRLQSDNETAIFSVKNRNTEDDNDDAGHGGGGGEEDDDGT